MRRIQFYPTEELDAKLTSEAAELGISVSSLVCDKLNQIYFKSGETDTLALNYSMLYGTVKKEIEDYVANWLEEQKEDSVMEFILGDISDTYRNIDMTMTVLGISKPSTLRARIGKTFNRQVSANEIDNVTRALTPSGELMFKHKSAVYRIEYNVDKTKV